MIKVTGMPKKPLRPGETHFIQIDGDGPFRMSISCFVDKPPPPGFKPCRECGSQSVSAGKWVSFTVSAVFDQSRRGFLLLAIRDQLDNEEEIRLRVVGREEGTATGGAMATG